MSSHHKTPSINSSKFAIHPTTEPHPLSQDIDNDSISSYGTSDSSNNSQDDSSNTNPHKGFNSTEYLYEALNGALNNNEGILDRAFVDQAQTSGILKAKSVELQNLEKEISSKLEDLQIKLNGNNNSFKEMFLKCQKNLSNCEKLLNKLEKKVDQNFPIEFNEAKDDVLTRAQFIENDQKDLEFLQK